MAQVQFKNLLVPSDICYSDTDKHRYSTFENTGFLKMSNFVTIVPFKVRFTSVGIPGIGSMVPPIGIAIIGVNNYIL